MLLISGLLPACDRSIRRRVPLCSAAAPGPFVLINLRVLLAGSVLVVVAAVAKRRFVLWPRWRSYLLGAVNAAIPYTLIAIAALHLPASMLATFNATISLFTALVAAVWLGEAMRRRSLVDLILGITGVGAMVGWSLLPLSAGVMVAIPSAARSSDASVTQSAGYTRAGR